MKKDRTNKPKLVLKQEKEYRDLFTFKTQLHFPYV